MGWNIETKAFKSSFENSIKNASALTNLFEEYLVFFRKVFEEVSNTSESGLGATDIKGYSNITNRAYKKGPISGEH